MHPYDRNKRNTSAHFRFRNNTTAAPLFDGAAHSGISDTPPPVSELRIISPSVETFITAHHQHGHERTLDEHEATRAVNAADRILSLLSDGEWHDMPSIVRASAVFGAPQRLRSLRKLFVTIDGTTWHLHIDRRRSAPRSSVWEYRARLDLVPQAPPTKQHRHSSFPASDLS